ncbi:MAG: hypothetical protein AABX16_03485 [Nanoarchaeota archaeon]
MKLLMFIVLFLFLGAFFIIAEREIPINSADNVALFFSHYSQWIDSVFENTKMTSGYIVKMEWLPQTE